MPKRWIVPDTCPKEWIDTLRPLPPGISQILWNRGIRTIEEAQVFFSPDYEQHTHDPFLFSEMKRACDRVFQAIDAGEQIVVFGDYDADGITGSTTVLTTLKEIAPHAKLDWYIPHRDKEGYGLQMDSAKELADRGAKLIITVDCGIACVPEVAYLKERGVDTIIVDHHQFGEELPDAIRIHPSLPGETYPFKFLAAVGVAWKFASALLRDARKRGAEIPESFEKWLMDLVAIATVTDVVPLIGENRVLEYFGLKALNKTKRPGLKALITSGGLHFGEMTTRDIGFVIGPRLNATSRMEHAEIALRLLLSETDDAAWSIAQEIEKLNKRRQEAMKTMMKEAEDLLKEKAHQAHAYSLYRADWSPALVGLVAGRISDQFGKPVIAIGKHGNQWIGSGRSFPWYDITEAVRISGEGLLKRSGGHIQACGFALERDEDIPVFSEKFVTHADNHLSRDLVGPYLNVDAELELKEIRWPLIGQLQHLQPYGEKNPEPVFYSKNIFVMSSVTVGSDDKHLRIVGKQGDTIQKFIGFGFGKDKDLVRDGSTIDIAYTLGINSWNGSREIQCKILDLNPEPRHDEVPQKITEDRLAEVGLV